MATMDIFEQDAFSMVSMTSALENSPYQPGRLGQMGLFKENPIRTETVGIEQRDGVLSLIKTSERGAPIEQGQSKKRTMRNFSTVRIAKGDIIYASEIQNIRAFGSESEFQQVQAEVADRYTDLQSDMQLTHEHMRLGAIQGNVLDADGTTVINNWFTEFGITEAAEVNFDLGNPSPAQGAIRKKCAQIKRQMMKASKGGWVEGQTRIHAMCGDTFWDDLITHSEVERTYLNHSAAMSLREDIVYQSFNYGGITFENYRGTDDGSTVAIGADKARFFPVGGKDVFELALSPAEPYEFVNTKGKFEYGMLIPDRDRNMWVKTELYSYPLYVCKRPGMLQRAKGRT